MTRPVATLKRNYLELLHVSEGTNVAVASGCILQSLAPMVVGRGGLWPVLLIFIHKEGLCPSSGDINRMMMMTKYTHC
jgi:hypothetical protein